MKTTIILLATITGIGFGANQAMAGDVVMQTCSPQPGGSTEIFRSCDDKDIAFVPPKKIPQKAEKAEKHFPAPQHGDRGRRDGRDGGNNGGGGNGNGGGNGGPNN